MEKTISFRGVDSGLESIMSRLRRQAQDLSRQIITDSVAEGRALKDVNKALEEQLKIQQRKSSMNFAEVRTQLKEEREESIKATRLYTKDPSERKAELKQIDKDYKRDIKVVTEREQESSLQIKLLREIVESIKETSRKEIAEDKAAVERQIDAYEKGELTDLSEADEAKLLYQRQLIRGKGAGGGEQDQPGQMGFMKTMMAMAGGTMIGHFLERLPNTAAGIITQPNVYSMISHSLSFIPWIGEAASEVTGKAIESASEYQGSMGKMAGIRGGGFRAYRGWGKEVQPLGYNMSQYLETLSEVSRAGQGRSVMGDDLKSTANILGLERGYGMNKEGLMEVLKLSSGGGLKTYDTMNLLMKGANQVGALGKGAEAGENLSALPELLSIANEISRQELIAIGHVDTGINIKMMTELMNVSDAFSNPEVLKGISSKIEGGLTGAPTPQAEAIQYGSIAQMMPGASLWDIEKMREKGFGAVNEKTGQSYLGTYLKNLSRASTGKEEFYRNIKGAFGLSAELSEQMGEAFTSGKVEFNTEEWSKKISGQAGVGNIEAKGVSATGEILASTAKLTNLFMEKGDQMVEKLDKLIDEITKLLEGVFPSVAGVVEDMAETIQTEQKVADEMQKSSDALTRIAGFLSQVEIYKGFYH